MVNIFYMSYHYKEPQKKSSKHFKVLVEVEYMIGVKNISAKYKYSMITNFQSKYKYGNKSSKGIRISHWNKGHSLMCSRLAEVKNIISVHRPHIFGVSEANFNSNQDLRQISISDYSILLGPVSKNGLICLLLYVHKDVVFKVRNDLTDQDLCSIWLEAGLKIRKRSP